MKKALHFLTTLLVAGAAMASPLEFSSATIQTNGASLTTQTPDDDAFTSGWVDTVIVDFISGASDTNTVILKTLGDTGSGASRTILTLSNITADGVYPVRDLATTQAGVDITGEPARIPLQQDKLRLTATSNGSDTNATAVVMDVYVIVSPLP